LLKKTFKKIKIYKYNNFFKKIAIAAGYNGKPYLINQAKKTGCDTFITGEGHMFGGLFAKENKINLILIGHYQSEFFIIKIP